MKSYQVNLSGEKLNILTKWFEKLKRVSHALTPNCLHKVKC